MPTFQPKRSGWSRNPKKDDPADCCQVGFNAMLNDERAVVAGWKQAQTIMANGTPSGVEQHAKMASGNGEDVTGVTTWGHRVKRN